MHHPPAAAGKRSWGCEELRVDGGTSKPRLSVNPRPGPAPARPGRGPGADHCVFSTERHCVRLREIRPKGVLARPGTPRDSKSHLFATKWVAIKDLDAAQTRNLTRISLRIFLEGSRGSYLSFFLTIVDLTSGKNNAPVRNAAQDQRAGKVQKTSF